MPGVAATPSVPSHSTSQEVPVTRVSRTGRAELTETVALEDPLEIRLEQATDPTSGQRLSRSISITMRTPGHDRDLAVGFLYTEGVLGEAVDPEDLEVSQPELVETVCGPLDAAGAGPTPGEENPTSGSDPGYAFAHDPDPDRGPGPDLGSALEAAFVPQDATGGFPSQQDHNPQSPATLPGAAPSQAVPSLPAPSLPAPTQRSRTTAGVVRVMVAPGVSVRTASLERNFYTTSSCGVCGKASLAALRSVAPPRRRNDFRFSSALLFQLPERMGEHQRTFRSTGGLHAAALFNARGELQLLREDVGRHNAVDKLVGASFLADNLPLRQSLLLLSGRASFELLQKAVMAGIPAVAAIGAPSSLAIAIARDFDVTLVGFLREDHFNIYNGAERLAR